MAKKYYRGFTLIELLVVISIVALLAILVIISVVGNTRKANDSKRKADLDRIKIAVEEYEKDHSCYPPPALVRCDLPVDSPGTGLKPYLSQIPCDPLTHAPYPYEPDPAASSCPDWFRIYTVLQNTGDTTATPLVGPNDAYNYYVYSPNAPASSSVVSDVVTNYYGCVNGACVSIKVDTSGNAVCTNYTSSPSCQEYHNCTDLDTKSCEMLK